MMPWLLLNGKKYSFDELTSLPIQNSESEFEKATLAFCKSWLNNQKEFIIQTSGSTGIPKQISLQRHQMEASARQTIEALQLKAGETSLVCLDTKYIAGQMMLVRSLMAEMNIVVIEPSSHPFDKIENESIDFVALVPYQLENILDHTPKKLDQVRCAIIGGAAISQSLKSEIRKCKCAIYATYGMTETLSHIALQRLNGVKPAEYFEAFPSTRLLLDARGCLCITTTYLPEEIITNDLVELIDDRKFRWLGRVDNVINSGGIKIIPEKIEEVFEKILDLVKIKNRFFVTGLPDEKLGSKVLAIFEGLPFEDGFREEILLKAGQYLNKYELPKELIFIPKFKETATKKINRLATVASIQ
jgi:O-succinylbenzoic acid--CoA ligase